MNMSKKQTRQSKRLSWLLRHGAPEAGLAMDPAGWMSVAEVLRYLGMSRGDLDEVVRTNNKRRIQVEGARVRCCQGHSTASGVSAEALEASWRPYAGEALVWHGTAVDAVASIAEEGIKPQARTHVHLAPTTGSVVGKRAQVEVMLGADPGLMAAAGEPIFVAQNGVILARRVPASCVVEIRAMTAYARTKERELGGLFPGARRSA